MIRISKKALSLQSYSRVEHMDQEKFSLLSKIKYPDDLRKLSIDQLPQVCKELREDIIDEVAVNPWSFCVFTWRSRDNCSPTLRIQYS